MNRSDGAVVPGKHVNVLGVEVSALNLELAWQRIAEAIERRRSGYVCVTGVHGVCESLDNPEFRRILNDAFLNTPDGMPLVWLGRMNGFREMDRVYGPDLMELVCERSAERGWRHFFYGGAPGTVELLRDRLVTRFPGLRVVGCFSPPFRPLNPEEESDLVQQVKEVRPDIFWVGLSTPKQEKFMSAYLHRLDTTLMFGVGAAFDFHAGKVRQAPKWVQRSGFEWFYRLLQEPRRLWRRYLVNNPRFVWNLLLRQCGLRQFPAGRTDPYEERGG